MFHSYVSTNQPIILKEVNPLWYKIDDYFRSVPKRDFIIYPILHFLVMTTLLCFEIPYIKIIFWVENILLSSYMVKQLLTYVASYGDPGPVEVAKGKISMSFFVLGTNSTAYIIYIILKTVHP